MTKTFALAALVLTVGLGAAGDAGAYERRASSTGPRGTSTVDASGWCNGGSCARSITRTGPGGNSVNRSGSASCADGSCTGTSTTTGPGGQTRTRTGSVTR
ncbi:hypothetical protein EOD42_24355 [Rhodovarius crocodyli]|uniref:Uncharacterized protein n=1 Tax=Rhodovarius crocodyli TaxID=1979269 RepID=A0A437LXA8_9PROT|nr:hypothetical protein [Rhodovarius crocodyli]RVT90022.1 hypothetical protein EOD42_24355 [Rhodovarius crocodyli]